MMHGFTGNKTESNGLFRYLSEVLENNNISSLRFDWFGHGESDIAFSDIRVPFLLKQANDIVQYATTSYKQVFVLGFSMGGALALETATSNLGGLILLAPATNMTSITNDLFQQTDQTIVDVHGYLLHRDFANGFEQLQGQHYHGPVLILQGELDQAVPKALSKQLAAKLSPASYHEIPGADHCFSSHFFHQKIAQYILSFLS
jgi:pimeloyl-ACP methyl ester carboxylesterase